MASSIRKGTNSGVIKPTFRNYISLQLIETLFTPELYQALGRTNTFPDQHLQSRLVN